MSNENNCRKLILSTLNAYTVHIPEKPHSTHDIAHLAQKVLSRVTGHGPAGIRRFSKFTAAKQENISADAYIIEIAKIFSAIYQDEGDTNKRGSTLMKKMGEILKNYFMITEMEILDHSPREPQASNVMGASMFAGYRYDQKMGLALAISDKISHTS